MESSSLSSTSHDRCKVVFLINSLCEGGAERVVLSLSKKFSEENHPVTILTLTKNNFYPIPKGVEVVYLSKMDDALSSVIKMLYIPYHAWRLKQYVKDRGIKVVQSSLFRANFVNILSGILGATQRIQVVNHSVVSRFFKEGLSGKINLSLIGYLYPKAETIITISKEMKSDFNRHFFVGENEKVIYNPYDVEAVLQGAKEEIEDFIFMEDKRYLIVVGRLIPLKRFEDTLQLLSRLESESELIVLGDGEERENLKALAETLSIASRVHFLGQVENPFKYIKRSDIFILSSRVEGFPSVLIEAMLCETVVISSDCLSGPREILAPSSDSSKRLSSGRERVDFGILYGVGDINALVESVWDIFTHKDLYLGYQKSAFRRAKEFSLEVISSQYKEVLCNG